jgi:hypothetical protein
MLSVWLFSIIACILFGFTGETCRSLSKLGSVFWLYIQIFYYITWVSPYEHSWWTCLQVNQAGLTLSIDAKLIFRLHVRVKISNLYLFFCAEGCNLTPTSLTSVNAGSTITLEPATLICLNFIGFGIVFRIPTACFGVSTLSTFC